MKKLLFGLSVALGLLVSLSAPALAQTVSGTSLLKLVSGPSLVPVSSSWKIGNSATNGAFNNLTISGTCTGCGGSGSGIGTSTLITQTAHGFSVGQWVGLTGSSTAPYALTNAVPGGVYQGVGWVAAVPDANHFLLQTSGTITDTNLIPGMTYYLSASSTLAQGTDVGYPPTVAGDISAPVAIATSQTIAQIQIGRPSTVAQSTAISGINVGNDFTASTYLSTSTMIAQAAVIQKNLASNRIRIALPTFSNAVGVYNMRQEALYYKSLGYYVSYGVTGNGFTQNSTTYAAWIADVPTEAAWASANGIPMFYIGNEESNEADIGAFGTVTGTQIRSEVLTLSTTLKTAYPNMRIVYSDAQGTVIEWHNLGYPYFGALDSLGFNMYDTQSNFPLNIAFFQSEIGSKYFVSEWAANYGYYDEIHSHGETDTTYAADLASRATVLQQYGLEAYFFALSYGDNTVSSGNYNILTNTGVFLPGAVSAFGGVSGNQVLTTPLGLLDDQVMYFNSEKTSSLESDITNFNITAPQFGNLMISGRTTITSTQVPTFNIAYDGTDNATINVGSNGLTTFDAHGPDSLFSFADKVGIGTTTPDSTLDVNGNMSIENGNGIKLHASVGNNNYSTIAYDTGTGKVDTTWPFDFDNGGISTGNAFAPIAPPTGGAIFAGTVGVGTSSPYADLSIAGLSNGTTDIFAVSTSTTATSTAIRISKNGNLHFMSGAGIDIGTGNNPGGNNLFVLGTASTTNFTVSGLPNCNTTSALTTNASGAVACGSVSGGGSSFAWPFTPTTNFAVNTSATSTVLNATAGIFASSTSEFVNANFFDNVGIGTTSPFISGLSLQNGTFFSPEVILATSTTMSLGIASSTQQTIRYSTSAITINVSSFDEVPGMKTTLVTCDQAAGTAGAITFNGLHFSGGVQPGNTTAANQCDMWYITVINGTSTPIAVLTGMTPGIQ